MIEYIKGIIAHKSAKMIVVECNQIGYQLLCSTSTINNAGSTGDDIEIFVQLIVREDSMTLYGFLAKQEREMFNKITSVSGIGAKIALGILSAMTTAQLAIALVTEDITTITKVKGIGQKTAKRMILELKEKVNDDELSLSFGNDSTNESAQSSVVGEAIQALMVLGFSSIEASKAVNGVSEDIDNVEQLITAALRTRGN